MSAAHDREAERDAAVAALFYDEEPGRSLAGSVGMMIATYPGAGDAAILERIERARRLRARHQHPAPSWETDTWVLHVLDAVTARIEAQR